MSKRSEIAALKAFPPKFTSPKRYAKRVQSEKIDTHATIRCFYQEGYEQAEKDTIERAIQWLIAHADDYIVDMEVNIYKPSKLHVGGMCWEHLKIAMEEE